MSVLIGVVLAATIQQLTGYFTETSRKPVKDIGRSSLTGPATVILSGISLGLESAVYAALLIGGAVYGAFLIGGGAALYAVALAGCGLLTTAGVIVAMDTFGPVSDNAQGIAEMSGDIDAEGARVLTDLDAVGNTTKAITKGIAIATAVLAATALFGSYNAQVQVALDEAGETLGGAFSLVNPNNVVGAVLGAAVVFFFSGLAISAVSRAAGRVVFEVREQFRTKPGIMDFSERPDYSAVVDICTKDSLRELATPGLLAVLAPVAVGFGLGIGPLAAYLVGAIAAGTLMAVFLANSGGAWDNAKKMVEDGAYGGKGSEAHAATVIGDTVGDPFKDTAGPAINPLIKVMNLVALIIAPGRGHDVRRRRRQLRAPGGDRAPRGADHRGGGRRLQAPLGRRRGSGHGQQGRAHHQRSLIPSRPRSSGRQPPSGGSRRGMWTDRPVVDDASAWAPSGSSVASSGPLVLGRGRRREALDVLDDLRAARRGGCARRRADRPGRRTRRGGGALPVDGGVAVGSPGRARGLDSRGHGHRLGIPGRGGRGPHRGGGHHAHPRHRRLPGGGRGPVPGHRLARARHGGSPVTAPVDLFAEARLTAIAAWDVPLVRGAVVTLGAVAGRLPVWRARLAEVARALEAADCWSGPAATSAASAVYDLSAVATAVDTALQESLDRFELLLREADAAQECATDALAMARTLEVGPLAAHSRLADAVSELVPEAAAPDPGPALAAADAALRHAAAVAVAAAEAGTALAGLGVRDAFAPADFWDLAGRIQLVGPVAPPEVRAAGTPGEVASWWAGLSAGAQLAALRASPGTIGALDGVPAWARDRANRLLLDRGLRDAGTTTAAKTARAVAERIAIEEAAGRPVQLHLLDLEAEQVVLVLGDLDTAEAVGLLVPGINNSPDGDLHRLLGDARDVAGAARDAGPGVDVATAVWLGYASPDNPWEIGTRFAAWDGGPHLAAALDGMAAARAVSGTPLPRTTVLAHSYGTVVVDEATDAPGRLAADAVVLLGSPGMEPEGADGLEAPEVYDAASFGDPISWSGYFGGPTYARSFGSSGLPVDRMMGHSDYYDPEFPTLAAIGAVVAGVRVPD